MSDKKEFVEMVREAIEAALSTREEATRQAKVEEVLTSAKETIDNLKTLIEEKDGLLVTAATEKEDLNKKVAEMLAEVQQLQERLSQSDTDKKGFETRAVEAETELAKIAQERRLEQRMAELASAKVAKTGNKMEAQKARVRDMDDEQFAAYKAELEDFRSMLEAELKASASAKEETNEDGIDVAPADVEKARKENAAEAAAIDVELQPGSSMREKYSALGEALAKKLKKESR